MFVPYQEMLTRFVCEESYFQAKVLALSSVGKTRSVKFGPKLTVLLKLMTVVEAGGRIPGLLGVGVDERFGRISNDDVGISWGRMSMMLLLLLLLSFSAPPLPLSWPLREPPLRLSVGVAALGTLSGGMLVAAPLETGLAIPGGRFEALLLFSITVAYIYTGILGCIRWELWWCGKASLD
jgi:hypothetical protein